MQQKKTIVYISQPTYGGVIEYLYMLLKNIDHTKFNNILVISEEYREYIDRFKPFISEVYYLPMTRDVKIKSVFKSVIKLRKILKKIKPDIVYMHSSMAGAVGRIALLFNTKIKSIYNAHGWYFNAQISDKKKKVYAIIEKILAFKSTKIINISKAEYDSAIQYKIAPAKKMCIIENGIDFIKFNNNDKDREEIRKKYKIKEDEIIIGVVGRLSEQKDPMTMIKAFELLNKEHSNTTLMYVGSGELEEEVKQYAKQAGLLDKIIITGWVTNVEKYIPAFDIAVLPSKWEGFGLVLIEYMACDKPIVATNVGGISNIIENGKNGLLTEIDNYKMLYENINELYENNNLKERIIEENKIRRCNFDIQKVVQQNLQLFNELLIS